jgi:hypothetical protein
MIVMAVMVMLLLFFIWASNFELDEVTVGVGKVIPTFLQAGVDLGRIQQRQDLARLDHIPFVHLKLFQNG